MLHELYTAKVSTRLRSEFGYVNAHEVPRLQKVVLNICAGDSVADSKAVKDAAQQLALISGQKPYITRAKKPIANFKLRAGMEIGCKVTLRGQIMYALLDKLVLVALPRSKDFEGLDTKSLDGRGNTNFGLSDCTIFPEIDYNKVNSVRGLNITIVTTARTDCEAKALLSGLQIPFYN